jgi:acylglycerol lipase
MTTFIKTAPIRSFDIPENASALLVIIHGMAEHSVRYRQTVQFFNARGIGCCTFDQRGHGKTVAAEIERGDIGGFAEFVNDAVAIVESVRGQSPRLPVFIWGHSMGALVAILAAARLVASGPGKIRGVITSSTPIASFDSYPSFILRLFTLLARIAPRLRLRRPFMPERLSRDLEVGRVYAADPLVPRAVTARFLAGLYGASVEALSVAQQLRLPWLALHGSDDVLAPPIGSQRLIDALGGTDKRLRLWPGARHELQNEIEPARTEFLETIADWIEARAK